MLIGHSFGAGRTETTPRGGRRNGAQWPTRLFVVDARID